jgi:hypothetical protein
MQLLPTAPGAYYLGRVYEDRGNTAEAVKLYKMAAGSKSAIGQEALGRLVRLDLAQNPETYLSIQPQLDNDAPLDTAIARPRRHLSIMSGSSAARNRADRRHRSVIPARKAVNLHLLGPFTTGDVPCYVVTMRRAAGGETAHRVGRSTSPRPPTCPQQALEALPSAAEVRQTMVQLGRVEEAAMPADRGHGLPQLLSTLRPASVPPASSRRHRFRQPGQPGVGQHPT